MIITKREAEVKILSVNKEEVERKLVSLGAKKLFDDIIETYYFSPAPRGAHSLRVRREGRKILVYVKKNLSQGRVKKCDEQFVEVQDLKSTLEALQLLGYEVKHHYVKRRVSYELGKARFDFDTLQGAYASIPPLLEVEASNEEDVFAALSLIGIPREEARNWDTEQLITYYSSKKPFQVQLDKKE